MFNGKTKLRWKKEVNNGSFIIEMKDGKLVNLQAVGSPEQIIGSLVYGLASVAKSADIPVDELKETVSILLDDCK